MKLCVKVEGSPRVYALPSSSSSAWPEMSNKSNPVSLLPHHVYIVMEDNLINEDSTLSNYSIHFKRKLLLPRILKRVACFYPTKEYKDSILYKIKYFEFFVRTSDTVFHTMRDKHTFRLSSNTEMNSWKTEGQNKRKFSKIS